jgi:hypothetical protein
LAAAYTLQLDQGTCAWTCSTDRLTARKRAITDAITILFVIFYLAVLLWRRGVEHQLRDHLRAEELLRLVAAAVADQVGHDDRHPADAAAVRLDLLQGRRHRAREADHMSSEFITLFMFGTMMVLLFTGQRVFGVIGFVGAAAALWLWGKGRRDAVQRHLPGAELVSADHRAVLRLHGLHAVGIGHGERPLPHVPCLVRPVRGGLALGTIG